MPLLWFAVGFVGFIVLDDLLRDVFGEDDDEGGDPRPDPPAPEPSGDSMPVSLEEVELANAAGRAVTP